ncbi:hypothetical protein SAMD00019534_121330 [Acytostelium subglobosum LB1]|uniref:hypothetical protein n=1 Tax=Acytostelium subglobosum LB1 TaxID=1410327 RepID=UPI000644A9D3|nr:hypothetical protein SAMD00019534_121330 [Acytostelium subglobosum LB1]GAM28957.1 hypothetical protein SAMD00019534_121330 [Acytostelium subglobosum LB1]|eukprot:XP_012748142.1 hypothetical protein SAMD00019534_121330 [Acytostelium subglobosum LB1]
MGTDHSAAIVNGECLMWGEVMGRKHTTLFKIVWRKLVASVSCGADHTLLLTQDSRVYAMGLNGAGQLGVDIADSAVPLPIAVLSKLRVTKVVAGNQVSAAITASGDLYMWGSCRYGQLANGRQSDKTHQLIPLPVQSPMDHRDGEHIRWTKVAFGEQHTLAITDAGLVYSWGANSRGCLGIGHCNDKLVPVPVLINNQHVPVLDVAAGGHHSALLTRDGMVYTWGANTFGQLGNGTEVDSPHPQLIQVDVENKKTQHIALGTNHSIILTYTGEVYTFGAGDNHQLGHGNTRNRLWPSLIVRPKIKASAIYAAGDCSALFVQDDQSILSSSPAVTLASSGVTGHKHLSLFVGTWNCNGKRSTNLANWLLTNSFAPDIIVIGLQEIVDMKATAIVKATAADGMLNKDKAYHPWKHDIEQTLALCSGATYVKVMSKLLVGLMIMVFVKEEHAPFVEDACRADVPCGAMGKIGNKGGVAIRFSLYKTGFCFVNSHLAAGPSHDRMERRAQDFKRIQQMMSFDGNLSMLDHECLVWFGDLNYRIDLSQSECKQLVQNKNWQTLMASDQLATEMGSGRAFIGFSEQSINFAPTYKYDIGTTIYDTSEKNRTPSYCDRILYRGEAIKPLVYRRHELHESDHRPISSLFLVEVNAYQVGNGGWTRFKCAEGRSESPIIHSPRQLHNSVVPKITIGLNQLDPQPQSQLPSGPTKDKPAKQLPLPPLPPKSGRNSHKFVMSRRRKMSRSTDDALLGISQSRMLRHAIGSARTPSPDPGEHPLETGQPHVPSILISPALSPSSSACNSPREVSPSDGSSSGCESITPQPTTILVSSEDGDRDCDVKLSASEPQLPTMSMLRQPRPTRNNQHPKFVYIDYDSDQEVTSGEEDDDMAQIITHLEDLPINFSDIPGVISDDECAAPSTSSPSNSNNGSDVESPATNNNNSNNNMDTLDNRISMLSPSYRNSGLKYGIVPKIILGNQRLKDPSTSPGTAGATADRPTL